MNYRQAAANQQLNNPAYSYFFVPLRRWILGGILILGWTGFCFGSTVRIVGTAQLTLVSAVSSTHNAIETAKMVILVDGHKYLISYESTMGATGIKEEIGSDGIDTFVVQQEGEGKPQGLIYSGRFPVNESILVQTAWLGYCSDGFFENVSNCVGLPMSDVLSWTPKEHVTNRAVYWPGSTLPQTIIGWSGNWVQLPGRKDPIQLTQYPEGFMGWKFTGSEEEVLASIQVPHRLSLSGFVPKRSKEILGGEDTTATRKVVFVVDSVQLEDKSFDPLPKIPVASLQVDDRRFLAQTIQGSRQGLLLVDVSSNGWPIRSSAKFNALSSEARQIADIIGVNQPKPDRRNGLIFIIFAVNTVLLFSIIGFIRKKRKNNQ